MIKELIEKEKHLLKKINNLEHDEQDIQELLNIAVKFFEYYKNAKTPKNNN